MVLLILPFTIIICSYVPILIKTKLVTTPVRIGRYVLNLISAKFLPILLSMIKKLKIDNIGNPLILQF